MTDDDSNQAGDRPRRVWQDAGGAVAHHDQRPCALPRQVGHDQHDQHDHHDEEDENDHGGEGAHLSDVSVFQMCQYLTRPPPDINMTVTIHLYTIGIDAKKD